MDSFFLSFLFLSVYSLQHTVPYIFLPFHSILSPTIIVSGPNSSQSYVLVMDHNTGKESKGEERGARVCVSGWIIHLKRMGKEEKDTWKYFSLFSKQIKSSVAFTLPLESTGHYYISWLVHQLFLSVLISLHGSGGSSRPPVDDQTHILNAPIHNNPSLVYP